MSVRNLIFISIEDWDAIWRRNQFVCAELSARIASRDVGGRILFVGLPRNVSNELRHGRLSVFGRKGAWTPAGFENITVIHPWKLLPDSIGICRRINAWMLRKQIRGAVRRLGMHEPVLWINDQAAVHLVGKLQESAVIYDITDDWTTSSQPASVLSRIKRDDEQLCRAANAVIVCSQKLFHMKQSIAPVVHLIPNGVDAEHYSAVSGGTGALPKLAEGWKKPVFGYTGTVHPDRVDVELVRRFAGQIDGTVVLLGPNLLPPAERDRLNLPNVLLPGPVAYAELPQYMRAFDVCIVPHLMTAFTESLNPIKLWEYLAAGKPIVSTDVAGFRDYPQFVRLARNADEFVAAARQALDEDKAVAAARMAEARKHSWSQRVDEIERVIGQALEPSIGAAVHA